MTPEILNLLFPMELPSIEDIEAQYPLRSPEAVVTRVAPSPTGFMHVGTVYAALLNERIAHQSQGVFFLRIEDTDQERYIPEAVPLILTELARYGIFPDEGPTLDGTEKGLFAPYTQSKRKHIYQAYVKHLVEQGKAYPCFCTKEERELVKKLQEKQSIRPGYHGKYAKCRHLSDTQILEHLKNNHPFVIRFKSTGDYNQKQNFTDLIKGNLQLPQNDIDVVIMKQDGLPTYHFAHVVDDHLMGTTYVMRGDEWLSSLPLHTQLFDLMQWKAPNYGHFAPLQKIDNGNKRKLSKRHDPEANISFFWEKGYPKQALLEYLTNLISSGFEDWRKANIDKDMQEYEISFKKISNLAGALFDFVKLSSISKEVIARMTAQEVYTDVYAWASDFNPEFKELLGNNKDLFLRIFSIERLIGPKSRKDIIKWEDVPFDVAFFFKENFPSKQDRYALLQGFAEEDIQCIAQQFFDTFDVQDDKDTWFAKIKEIAFNNGFATDNKAFKANPSAFKGNISDVAKIIRVLLTGRDKTPDLWSIMQILDAQTIKERLI